MRYDGTYCPGPDGRFDAIVQTSRNVTGSGAAGGASYHLRVTLGSSTSATTKQFLLN